MGEQSAKWVLAAGIAVLLVSIGAVMIVLRTSEVPPPPPPVEPPPPPPEPDPKVTVLGTSVEGRAITSFRFGDGNTDLLFVGGVHGGYEWNTVILSYEIIDFLTENPEIVPENLTVTVIPNMNPDGVYAVVGKEGRFVAADAPQDSELTVAGRFNAHDVDLNRNFDCKWQPESTWRGNKVSAGTEAFSEPEVELLRQYVVAQNPAAAVFYHSQGNAVYGSECESGILPVTLSIMETYADAAGYQAIPSFDAYPITGDAEGWLASIGIPAITVELSTHEIIEREKNISGVQALLRYYGK